MNIGQRNAIELAKYTITKVPAYRQFLNANKISTPLIKTANDFQKLPITNKVNYIHKFQLLDLSPTGRIPNQIHSSSGSSGTPTFWFRDFLQDGSGGLIHQKIFSEIFKIPKNSPTLVIICFSMGVWVAGGYTLSSCRWLSAQGYNLSCITPGIEKHDISNILKGLAPKFENVILVGYPSFIMDILNESKKYLPKNLKILTSGDSFSEDWRRSVLKLLGQIKSESIINLYGSADAGAIAFETPLTILVKKAALKNRRLFEKLFGSAIKEPSLLQFLPKQMYIESINDELILTSKNTIPLIRYNIHDRGRVLSPEEMKKNLSECGISQKIIGSELRDWDLPFVIQYGRTDVAVTFYALNIYPEHIQAGLKDKKISQIVSGNFNAYNKVADSQRHENLYLEIELAKNIRPTKKVLNTITKTLFSKLLKLNTEYRKLHGVIGLQAMPKIKLHRQLNLTTISGRTLINLKGKKPKIVF